MSNWRKVERVAVSTKKERGEENERSIMGMKLAWEIDWAGAGAKLESLN